MNKEKFSVLFVDQPESESQIANVNVGRLIYGKKTSSAFQQP